MAFLHGPRRSSFHLFLLVAWNLLTRPDNTNDLHVNHINWTLDCLQVVVHCHKGDPTGVNGYKFKHVYSNPLDPWIDVFLAFGIWLVTKSSSSKCIFNWDGQEENFNSWLRKVLKNIDSSELG